MSGDSGPMENVEIARILNEYAALLEIQGESPFRIRAYHPHMSEALASRGQSSGYFSH